MASPFVAAWFVERMGMLLGMRVVYLLTALIYFSAAALRIKLRETLRSGSMSVSEALRSYLKAVREGFRVWRSVPRQVFWLSMVYIVSFTFTWLCIPYYVIYATDVLGVSEGFWALLMAVQNVSMYLPSILLGKLVDMFGRVKPLVASMSLLALGTILFVLDGGLILTLAFVLSGVSSVLFNTAYQSLQTDLVSTGFRGRVIGFTNFFAYMFEALAQLVGGYVYEAVSPTLPFMLLALSQVPLIALTLLTLSDVDETSAPDGLD